MNFTWVSLATVAICGLILAGVYFLGRPRKVEKIKREIAGLEKELEHALADNKTFDIARIRKRLRKLRAALRDLEGK